ncbi:hypothetical protein G9A89_009554 [Geosiphon pyriformis]|nr:hypothetical protein G9A89_009554 [Geosiphon pyriformis]
MVLDLYTGVSSETRFSQALKVNSVIAETVNFSTFVVLSRNFNKNGSERSATFNENLSFAVTGHQICSVSGFFDTDYNAVLVLIGLGELLNVWLNSLCKQTNKDCWKFKIKDADGPKWTGFKDCLSAKLLVVTDEFFGAETHGNMDAIEFYCSKNKFSSKFFGLELLVAKIVKKFGSGNLSGVDCLVKTWSTLDSIKTCAFANLVGLSGKSEVVLRHLSLVCKEYRRSKIYKSRLAEKATIRLTSFHKVVLDHLVVNDKLILEPKKIKLNVNRIMEGWIRKWAVSLIYALLDYVQNCAFSSVIGIISLGELLLVVNSLPDGKAAGLFSIPNKLWKHDSDKVLRYFLRLLNACLLVGNGILTNTQPIALIETAKKILFKILSDKISSVYNKFGVLHVFAVGLVVKDALEKDPELWLVFQDICKAYDSGVKVTSLSISGQLISIARKSKAHRYLGIFLSTKGLSKSSVAKAYSDVHFFVNVVLKKVITNKQFFYLVLAVLQPIVNYKTHGLHEIWSGSFDIYTDGLLKDVETADVADGTAVYFFSVNLSVGVKVWSLLSFTLFELQAVALALKCIPSFCAVVLYLDSQTAINTCVSKMSLAVPDFHVPCWIEKCYIFNLIKDKYLVVRWIKVKGYSGVVGNVEANAATGHATYSKFSLSIKVHKHFLVAEATVMSGNTRYFVKNMFQSICHTCWKTGPDQDVVSSNLVRCVDWSAMAKGEVLAEAFAFWFFLLGINGPSSSADLQALGWCSLDVGLYLVLCKEFVFKD